MIDRSFVSTFGERRFGSSFLVDVGVSTRTGKEPSHPSSHRSTRRTSRGSRASACQARQGRSLMTVSAPATPYLNCPRCGLSIALRSRWLAVKHCPRCVARTHTIVELFSSRLPAHLLYAENRLPQAEAEPHIARQEA
jgi:hypothetical protein